MAQYYGVERSEEYLEHYGIKGMKWGVQKAKETGNTSSLDRHYLKAKKKLAKLSLNADREASRKIYNAAKTRMARGSLGSALGSAALSTGMNGGVGLHTGLSAAAGGLLGAVTNSRGIMSGRHISDRGHARAVQKRDEFQREMNDAFKGTKYGRSSKRRRR